MRKIYGEIGEGDVVSKYIVGLQKIEYKGCFYKKITLALTKYIILSLEIVKVKKLNDIHGANKIDLK